MLTATSASAATDPYTGLGQGYDVSYPQCGGPMPTGAFAVVGVNGGRPFTFNSCFATEYSAAPNPSAYINTGYATAYRKSISSYCSRQGHTQAWQIGCSEADTSVAHVGAKHVAMWWLDVEAVNSWSTGNLSLNRQTIQGATDRLAQTGLPVGVYSTATSWRTITGSGFTPSNSAAEWVAGVSCTTPFDAAPVWLSQTTGGGFDYDTAC